MKKFFASLLFLLVMATPAFAGFTLGTYGDTGANGAGPGWSTFTAKTITTGSCAAGTADGTCAIYIDSASSGASCALTTVGDLTHLCKTFPGAMTVYGARNNKPDWILFKKGDTQTSILFSDDGVSNCCWDHAGASTTDLLVIGSYDPAAPSTVNPATGGVRPILIPNNSPQSVMQCQSGDSCNRMAVVGLEFYCQSADPNHTGQNRSGCPNFITYINPGVTFLLIEDVKLGYFNNGFLPQGNGNVDNSTPNTQQIYFRRNQTINTDGQGGEGNGNPLVVEETCMTGANLGIWKANATISQASPAVVTLANAIPNNGDGFVTFASPAGGILTGFWSGGSSLSPINAFCRSGTCYAAVNNNFSTFHLVPSNLVIGQVANTNSSTRITGINVSGMSVGDGVNCSTCGSTVASPVTISSIPSNFGITGNTHTTSTVDGIASTTGIFVGSNVSSADTACASSQPTIAPGTVVTAVGANSITISPAACATVGSLSVTVTPNTFVMSAAASDTAAHTITTFHVADRVNTSVGLVSPNLLTWHYSNTNGFAHSWYFADFNAPGIASGPTIFRGNITANAPSDVLLRGGGTSTQNAWVASQIMHQVGTQPTTNPTTVSNNVFLSATFIDPCCVYVPVYTQNEGNYNGNLMSGSTFNVTNNIVANAVSSGPSGYDIGSGFSGTAGFTYSGNIMYNFNNVEGRQFSNFAGSGVMTTGGIVTAQVNTGGSGYTDYSLAITSVGPGFYTNPPTAKINTGGLSLTNMPVLGWAYITGLTNSGGTCALNGVAMSMHWWNNGDSTQGFEVNGDPSHCSGTGTMYTQDLTQIKNLATTGCGGCVAHGSAATSTYISAGGSIVYAGIYGGDNFNGATLPQPGSGYQNGDTLTLQSAGGSGAIIQVTSVSIKTDGGGNKYDPTGSNPGAFPGCSAPGSSTSPNTCIAAKYYDHLIGSGGHTDQDFVAATCGVAGTGASGNYKAVWNPALTANNGLVPWVQAGFGQTGGGGVRGLGRGKGL